MKYIYLLVGPSGVGKTTIANKLEEKYGFTVVQSYTDRAPRYPGEKGHIFVSTEEFDELKAAGFVAYTLFDGYRYGVPQSMIDESDIYIIDPFGVETMKKNYSGPKKIAIIGLTESLSVLIERMEKRGDTLSKIRRRITNDSKAFKEFESICDVLIRTSSVESSEAACIDFIKRKEKEE